MKNILIKIHMIITRFRVKLLLNNNFSKDVVNNMILQLDAKYHKNIINYNKDNYSYSWCLDFDNQTSNEINFNPLIHKFCNETSLSLNKFNELTEKMSKMVKINKLLG